MQTHTHDTQGRPAPHSMTHSIAKWALVAACCLATFSLLLNTGCQKEEILDPFASYEYFESSLPGIGARTLTIHTNGEAELNTFKGTRKLDLSSENDLEQMISGLKNSLSTLSKDDWNHKYVKTGAPWFRRLTRMHPEGIYELEYHSGAEAPAEITAIMEKFHKLVEEIAAKQEAEKLPS